MWLILLVVLVVLLLLRLLWTCLFSYPTSPGQPPCFPGCSQAVREGSIHDTSVRGPRFTQGEETTCPLESRTGGGSVSPERWAEVGTYSCTLGRVGSSRLTSRPRGEVFPEGIVGLGGPCLPTLNLNAKSGSQVQLRSPSPRRIQGGRGRPEWFTSVSLVSETAPRPVLPA